MSNGLPQGWESVRLGGLFDFKYGKALPEEKRNAQGSVKVYGSNGVVGVHDAALTNGPTIVVGRKGSVGEVHLSPESCWPIDTTYFIDEFPAELPPSYWALYLKSLRLGQQEKSSAIPGISRNDVYAIEVPLPPLTEQRRIVAKLEKLLGRVDTCQKRLAKIPVFVKRFRQSVLAAACSGRLTADWREENPSSQWVRETFPTAETDGELPENWAWVSFGDYVDNLDGKRIPVSSKEREKRRGKFPYYGASGVIDSIDGYTHDGEFLLIGEDGANLLSRSTPIAFLANGKIWVNNHAHVLRCKKDLPNAYLCAYINSIDLASYVTGTAQPKLTQASMNAISVPIPPLVEQREIMRRVEALFGLADQIEARYRKAKGRVDKLTASLLDKAFRGELVPTEADLARRENRDYEDAESLLERLSTKTTDPGVVRRRPAPTHRPQAVRSKEP